MAIKMKAVGRGEIRQPENPGLGSHRTAGSEQTIEFLFGSHGFFETLLVCIDPQSFAGFFENTAGCGAESCQGEKIDPDKGGVRKKKAAANAEGQGLGTVETVMSQQVGGDPAFAVGRLTVAEIDAHSGAPDVSMSSMRRSG